MYKIFEVTYNDGGWHSGDLQHFFYIAKSKEEVVNNSKKYRDFLEIQKCRGGDIWINEVSDLIPSYHFENLDDFDIEITVRNKECIPKKCEDCKWNNHGVRDCIPSECDRVMREPIKEDF